jgi:hypothetical protein
MNKTSELPYEIFVKDEYLKLQDLIEKSDQRSFTVKSWSVTVSMSAVALAVTSSKLELYLLGSVSALLFWIIDAYVKLFQSAYISRANEIERLKTGDKEKAAPGIGRVFRNVIAEKGSKRFWSIFRFSQVMLPHSAIVLFGILAFITFSAFGK